MIEFVRDLVRDCILWMIQQKDVYLFAQRTQICLQIQGQTGAFRNARVTSLLTTAQGLVLRNATKQLDTWHTNH
jgi:hypothetical protein